jgi:hypothetical protein
MDPDLSPDNEPSPRPEPVSPDTPKDASYFFMAVELERQLDAELRATGRRHGRGRRASILERGLTASRRLVKALGPLAGA